MIKLTTVIPVYNRAEFIEDCVKSTLNQSNPNCEFEIIVVDDGSTDDTPIILSKFGKKITYKRISSSGRPAVPRNVGTKLAKGEYIAFQDSDDLWLPNKIKTQLPLLADPKVAMCYANASIMDEKGKDTGKKILNSTEQFLDGGCFDRLVRENYPPTLTVMVRKDIIRQAGGFDEDPKLRAIEDYHLWLRIAAKHSLASTQEVVAKYRSHEDNISTHDPIVSYMRQDAMVQSLLRLTGYFSAEQIRLLKNKRRLNRMMIADAQKGRLAQLAWKLRALV